MNFQYTSSQPAPRSDHHKLAIPILSYCKTPSLVGIQPIVPLSSQADTLANKPPPPLSLLEIQPAV